MADQTTYADAPAPTVQRSSAPDLPGSLIWYELLSPDPDASKSFYDSIVGWNIEATSGFPNGYRMIGRGDGKFAGGVLPLTAEMRGHGARPCWLGYIAVDDVDATAAAVKADGGAVLFPAIDIPNVGRIAMLADPQGAPFYIMRPTGNEASDAFSVDQSQHVRWNELSTTDPDAAIAFYTRHFGWVQEGDMDMGEMGKYRFLHANGVAIGAVMSKMPQMPVSAWTYYIGVDDIDRAAAAITAGDGTLLYEPMEIPGGEYALSALDPHQAMFGLVGPRHR